MSGRVVAKGSIKAERVVAGPIAVRAERLNDAKVRSNRSKHPVRVSIGRESFTYEAGKLVEYDYSLPELVDYD